MDSNANRPNNTVTAKEFRKDPATIMARATGGEGVRIVDAKGREVAVLSVPNDRKKASDD